MKWNKDDLQTEIEKATSEKKWSQWDWHEVQTQRKEYYLIRGMDTSPESKRGVDLDQDREVEENAVFLTIYVTKENGRQGKAQKQIFPGTELKSQLEELEKAAHLSDEEAWAFPEPSDKPLVEPERCYAGLKEDFSGQSQKIADDLQRAIDRTQSGEFNSSELFVTRQKHFQKLSNGFEQSFDLSKIYSEVCFSHRNEEGRSEEFLLTEWNSHPEQFDFEKMCRDSSEMAANSLNVKTPESGSYDVLISADVLTEVFHDVLSQLSSRARYFKMPFMEAGQEFVPGFEGQPFQLWLDPGIDYAFGSSKYDGTGVAQGPMLLVDNNKVVDNITDTQMAKYLERERTTTKGNVVVKPKRGEVVDDLRKSGDHVLEILQFSGLATNALDLTFSSEIRLGRLFNNRTGEVRYVKGGSVSGKLRENLKNVQWSKENRVWNHASFDGDTQGYYGPEMALLSGVTVSS